MAAIPPQSGGADLAGTRVDNAFALCDAADGSTDQSEMVYVHPLARLFEFTTGMTAALAWWRWSSRGRPGRWAGTVLELAALAFLFVTISGTNSWSDRIDRLPTIGHALAGHPGGREPGSSLSRWRS